MIQFPLFNANNPPCFVVGLPRFPPTPIAKEEAGNTKDYDCSAFLLWFLLGS